MHRELRGLVSVIAVLWLVHAIDWLIPIDFNNYGLVPRTTSGLIGVLTMPFLHGSWGHLLGNTIPLALLLFILCGSRDDVWEVIGSIVVLGGLLLWCFGRSAVHVGASGLVYGLIGFLIASGFVERKMITIFLSLLVGFFFGSSLFFGILPTAGAGVSWDGHLFGTIGGCVTAYLFAKRSDAISSDFSV